MITSINEFKKINTINENVEAFKTLPNNLTITVTSATKKTADDSYENGEDPATEQNSDISIQKNTFKSVKEIADAYGITADPENWIVFDDRIICQIMEDDNENMINTTDDKFKEFKDGKINLIAASYDFNLVISEIKELTSQELSIMLGIKNYD